VFDARREPNAPAGHASTRGAGWAVSGVRTTSADSNTALI